MKTNEILKIGNDLFVTNERKSIYKKEIFAECKTDKEKKNLRMKLRKKLDGFIATAIAFRNKKEELNKLRASWKQYATAIYQDINIIADANSNTEKSESIKQFLQLMTEPKQPKQNEPATTQTKQKAMEEKVKKYLLSYLVNKKNIKVEKANKFINLVFDLIKEL